MLKRYYKVIISIIGIYAFSSLNAQYQWAKIYGGTHHEGVYALHRTSDGGYIIAGETRSFGQGNFDLFIMKLNSTGGVAWARTFGGIDPDDARGVYEISDGYIVVGTHRGFTPLPENYNIYVVKVNLSGQPVWGKEIGGIAGGSGVETGYNIVPAWDGGYIVLGRTGVDPQSDFILIKLNSDGTISWTKTYGGSSYEYEPRITRTSDGGYLLTGETWSFGSWPSEFLVIKLDVNGNVLWAKAIGSYYDDVPLWVEETSDGGFIIAGRSKVYVAPYRPWDPVAIKINSSGDVIWAKRYEMQAFDQANDQANCCKQTPDGGYVLAGSTEIGIYNTRGFLLKLDPNGNLIWGRKYDPGITCGINCVEVTPDGGYILGGGIIPEYTDAYILKTNSEGVVLSPSGDVCEGVPFSPPVISHPIVTNLSVQITVTNYNPSVYDTILPSTIPNLTVSTECDVVGINENCACCKSLISPSLLVSNIGKEFNIKYSLPRDAYVSIKLYNSTGNLIWTLFEGKKEKGRYNLIVDAKNLKPGLYFCVVKRGEEINKVKIIVTP
ncbi:MAG: T9SS type A sorting domain-containing protein [candidate division WOR-3 bacterium]